MALGARAVERENTSNRETTSMLACILLSVSEEVEAQSYSGFPIRWALQALENYTHKNSAQSPSLIYSDDGAGISPEGDCSRVSSRGEQGLQGRITMD